MAGAARCGRWVLRWCRGGDEVVVANRIVTDCEFEHAVEDESAAARGAPVEAEHELVEIALQMSLIDGALMGAEQPALCKRGDPVHAWQQFGWVVAGLLVRLVDCAGRGRSRACRSCGIPASRR